MAFKSGPDFVPVFWPEKWLQKFEARLFGFTFLDADLCPDSGRKNGTTAVGPRVVPFAYSCPASLKPAGSQVSGLRVLFWPGIILCSLIHWSDLCFEASRGRTGICHSIFGFRSFVALLIFWFAAMAGDAYQYELFIEPRIGKSRSEILAEDEPAPVQGAGEYVGVGEGHGPAGQSDEMQLCKRGILFSGIEILLKGIFQLTDEGKPWCSYTNCYLQMKQVETTDPEIREKPGVVRYASILRGLETRFLVSGTNDFTLTATVSWLRNARLAETGPDMKLHVSSDKRYSAIPDGVTDITSIHEWVEQERFLFPVKGVSISGILYGVSSCISDPACQMLNQIQMNISIAEIVVGCLILFQKFRNSGLPAGRMTKFYRMHDPESQFGLSSNVVLRISMCDHPEWQLQCEGTGSGNAHRERV